MDMLGHESGVAALQDVLILLGFLATLVALAPLCL